MARKINPVPKGYHTSTPVLVVQDAAAAIEFYCEIFGAKELSRLLSDDGLTILRSELKIGNSVILLNDEMPAYGILSPASLGGAPTALQLYLPELDAVWARAVKAYSHVLLPLEDVYWGERTGKLVDPFGHVWILSKKTEVLSQEEIKKRAALISPLAFGQDNNENTSVQNSEQPLSSGQDAVPIIDIAMALNG
ncbi:VOC family protein [Kiloniella laminariae]|uniref:VOC family protein n=1 Tax=Kiloniella laminariae TaxID=454162 RepID=UPI001B7FEF8F|nr:VOC family protein [Kiloniella laminariae]